MYRDSTYKEKFAILKDWSPVILDKIKKDLRNDHIRQDFVFAKKYMKGKPINKLTLEDMVEGYNRAIAEEEKGEEIAEFIANRWMLTTSDLYGFFEKELYKIDPNFTDIKEIPAPNAEKIIQEAIERFGALSTYLFSVINSVAFSKDHFEDLRQKAAQERDQKECDLKKIEETVESDKMRKEFEMKLSRLEDKYEKKLEGLQKKYLIDTESLKKQISTLQKKLNASS